ncbi:nucleolin [Eupeodes corollae]|uniref:nucleolin n=1 Tax=Eupeodes corollae TaxID=290404 RepID=UPI00249127C1|nr:nucleolin [Eupeodes corollae]
MSSSENEDVELNEEQSSAEEEDDEVASDEEGEEQPEDEDSGAEEHDINASATESDEDDDDDEVDDDEDVPATKNKKQKEQTPLTKNSKITEAITERHEKRKGRQLYIRFPEKLPESVEDFQKKIKSLSSLIVDGHKPRQKHARFCLVDFANTEDRDIALKELSKKESNVFVSIPKTDDDEFVKTLIDKKIKQAEKKRAKNMLRKQSKKTVLEKQFTSTLMVLNLPSSATNAQIKELFTDAVDIQTKKASGKFSDKMIATVTLPSTEDAKKNYKRKLVLGGNDLIIRFNNNAKKRGMKKNKKGPQKPKPGGAAPKKGPIAPAIVDANNSNSPKKPNKSPKKRSLSENGKSNVPEKKAKGKNPMPPSKKGNASPAAKNGKPNNKNKQKNKSPKKGKAVLAPVAAVE